jgi:hypothetical protein
VGIPSLDGHDYDMTILVSIITTTVVGALLCNTAKCNVKIHDVSYMRTGFSQRYVISVRNHSSPEGTLVGVDTAALCKDPLARGTHSC